MYIFGFACIVCSPGSRKEYVSGFARVARVELLSFYISFFFLLFFLSSRVARLEHVLFA